MAEKPKESLADLKKGAYQIDPTVLGQAALGPALSESLLPERGPPLSVEEWRARNEPGRFDPVEASIALVGGPRGRGIRAYHSSPHDFERFDLSKVGIGEGHQTYGHGMYFAESPEVSGRGGQYWKQFKGRFSEPERMAADYMMITNFNRDDAARAVRQALEQGTGGALRRSVTNQDRSLQEALRLIESGKPIGPRTYEVNIKAEPEQFLQWDRPGHQQPQAVRDLVIGRPELQGAPTGEALYNRLAMNNPSNYKADKPAASAILQEAGVPGITYPDARSRYFGMGAEDLAGRMVHNYAGDRAGAVAELKRRIADSPRGGEGSAIPEAIKILEAGGPKITSNYVVFSDKVIDILRKYGIIGAVGGAAATKKEKADADN